MGYQNNKKQDYEFPIVNKKLSDYFNDSVNLYLPEGLAYEYANEFKNNRIENHQMRKVLDTIKEAKLLAEYDFEESRKKIFMIVTMSAYNAGRLSNLRQLYKFVKNTINQNTIIDKEDIYAFDQFFTSIVAYHKSLGGK